MLKRLLHPHPGRFIHSLVLFTLPSLALSSCVSMAKYHHDLDASESERKDLIAKNSLLENDTTEYGNKYRMLQNDLAYLQNIKTSETEKLSSEKDQQSQKLNQIQSELASTRQQLQIVQARLSAIDKRASKLLSMVKDSLKNYNDTNKLVIHQCNGTVCICLKEEGWFSKEAPFISAETSDLLKKLAYVALTDSTLQFEIKRNGPEPTKSAKGQELSWGSPIMNKPYYIRSYFTARGFKPDHVKIVNLFSKRAGEKEEISIVMVPSIP